MPIYEPSPAGAETTKPSEMQRAKARRISAAPNVRLTARPAFLRCKAIRTATASVIGGSRTHARMTTNSFPVTAVPPCALTCCHSNADAAYHGDCGRNRPGSGCGISLSHLIFPGICQHGQPILNFPPNAARRFNLGKVYAAPQLIGQALCSPRINSNARAILSAPRSSCRLVMICKPIGSPPLDQPQFTLTAGCSLML